MDGSSSKDHSAAGSNIDDNFMVGCAVDRSWVGDEFWPNIPQHALAGKWPHLVQPSALRCSLIYFSRMLSITQ
jgi:hypothetical protein